MDKTSLLEDERLKSAYAPSAHRKDPHRERRAGSQTILIYNFSKAISISSEQTN
jgi:hypothetical protein